MRSLLPISCVVGFAVMYGAVAFIAIILLVIFYLGRSVYRAGEREDRRLQREGTRVRPFSDK